MSKCRAGNRHSIGKDLLSKNQHQTANRRGRGSRLHSLVYFPAQNSTPLAFGENQPVSGKLQGRTELNLTSVIAADSFL
jgi:hypothetical protein